MRANMRAGLKPAPTDGSPNNYELCIMNYIVVGFVDKKEGVSRSKNPF